MRTTREVLKSKKYFEGRFFGNGIKRKDVFRKIAELKNIKKS